MKHFSQIMLHGGGHFTSLLSNELIPSFSEKKILLYATIPRDKWYSWTEWNGMF
jgi:hypothetical protein